ncbi:hypothetical protein [Halomonas sp.]
MNIKRQMVSLIPTQHLSTRTLIYPLILPIQHAVDRQNAFPDKTSNTFHI